MYAIVSWVQGCGAGEAVDGKTGGSQNQNHKNPMGESQMYTHIHRVKSDLYNVHTVV